ncbi:MAG: hypothetical protein LBE62_03250 [Azonexus sp.]|jgi:hypothetical protein|nr:hypothetical protein [Azonexus sp.]
MEEVTQTFDRIFGVQQQVRDRFGSKFTTFGFESKGRRYFELSVQGWPTLNDGMTVTALLRKSDDWKSVVGWVAHDSGEIVCRDTRRHFVSAAWLLLITLIAALGFSVSTKGIDSILSIWAKAGLWLILFGFAVWEFADGINSIRERQRLNKILLALHIKGADAQSTPPHT